jgi:malate dehydrogenase (oxaloacetate-decarboxylating)(NADP+)
LAIEEARQRSWLFDVKGLVVTSRADLQDFQIPFSHHQPAIASFVEAIETIKPTCIIGVSTVPKLFNQQVIEAMSRVNERPIIFPYSNPTSRSECTAEEAYRWSNGMAIFASGSPFDPVQFGGRTFVPGQGNNVYIFPALGMAILATQAKRVTEVMFITAAKAVAEQVTQEQLDTGLIYPHQSQIFEASIHVAVKVAERIFDDNFAGVPCPADLEAHIRDWAYHPEYPEYPPFE